MPVSARWIQALQRLALGLALLWGMGTAQAHPMPESMVWLDTDAQGLQMTLRLPLNRLEYGFGQPLADAPDSVLPRLEAPLSRYLLQHIGARSGGRSWQVLRPRLSVQGHDASAELEAQLLLKAPPGADTRHVELLYDVITHEVHTHRVQVLLRNDWAGGVVGGVPELLGLLDTQHRSLSLELAPPSAGASLLKLVREGMQHIAEGSDHVVFLLLLLIVSPLQAARGGWAAPRPAGLALRHLAGVVTAFTVGHSITLALGSFGWVRPPEAPVEVAVALTVLLAAIQAWTPLWRGADTAMAAVFGTVHGMAFSASLDGAGLTVGQHALALLAFNGGIELMQLLIVLAVWPALALIARRQPATYRPLRQAVAVLGGVLACAWLLERLSLAPWGNWAGPDQALTQAPWAVVVLWGVGLWAWLRRA